MARYIPTNDGQGIVVLFDESEHTTCGAMIRSIPEAQDYLLSLRRDAWNERSRFLASIYLTLSNSLSDALTYAEELRGEGEKMGRAA